MRYRIGGSLSYVASNNQPDEDIRISGAHACAVRYWNVTSDRI